MGNEPVSNPAIAGVLYTPLKVIAQPTGSVLHALKNTEESFADFGEVYFSTLYHGVIKGWRRHNRMVMNIVVPSGEVRFVLFDDRNGSASFGKMAEYRLSRANHARLTIPPGVWLAFQGLSHSENILMNFASILHDPTEAHSIPISNDRIPFFIWDLK